MQLRRCTMEISASLDRDRGLRPIVARPVGRWAWVEGSIVLTLTGLLYFRVVVDLVGDWWSDPGLSQGMLIPPLSAYIAWIRRSQTLALPSVADNRGLFAVGLSSLVFIIGKLGAEFFLMRISLIILLAGIAWTYWGYARLRSLALPFLLLATMVPLPRVVYNSLATPLQLFASDVSANIARELGITVYREGNIISLANITLGVEEACSGLNSLSSLVVASALLGFLLCANLRSRLTLLLLAIPLAVGVNVVRITGTALVGDYRPEFAVGFYHSFSGWLIFVTGFACLYLLARALHALLDS
jgi:exosortase